MWLRRLNGLILAALLTGGLAPRLDITSVYAATARQPALPATVLQDYPWLFLRDDRPFQEGEATVEVVAVGDINLGRGMASEAEPFAAAAPWLQAADLAFGNLECVIAETTDDGRSTEDEGRQPYRLVAGAGAADLLAGAGFDLLGLANNHSLDAGPEGLSETAGRLDGAGLTPVGAGQGISRAYRPVFRNVRGIRLAFLAFNAVPAVSEGSGGRAPASHWSDGGGLATARWASDRPLSSGWRIADWNPERAAAAVRQARGQADSVIVSIHWGYEYELRPDPAQVMIAQALHAAGAEVIIGHHPHVVQRGGVLTGPPAVNPAVVAYSLGNFTFDQEFVGTRQGLALRLLFDDQGLRAAQVLPLTAGRRPQLLGLPAAAGLLARVLPPAETLAYTCRQETCTPAEPPEAAAGSGRFTAGQADLTGDGRPESLRLQAGRVIVGSADEVVWKSPPEWQASDLATGDPDSDGRVDLVLALWKPDEAGVLRSHPFVIGFRGGLYRTIWGGSPVGRPIHELELGDLDSDGRQELIVLEDTPGGSQRTVSVWRWHGWGFSLTWRSAPGDYGDLLFVPGSEGAPAVLLFNRLQ